MNAKQSTTTDPVYEYVDNQVDYLYREILSTRRNLARFIIVARLDYFQGLISQNSSLKPTVISQLVAKANTMRARIDGAKDPLAISTEFDEWAVDFLKKQGVGFIQVG